MSRIPDDAQRILKRAANEAMAMSEEELQEAADKGLTERGFADVTFNVEGCDVDVRIFRTEDGDFHVAITVTDDFPDFHKITSTYDNQFLSDIVDELETIIAGAGGPSRLNLGVDSRTQSKATLCGDTPV